MYAMAITRLQGARAQGPPGLGMRYPTPRRWYRLLAHPPDLQNAVRDGLEHAAERRLGRIVPLRWSPSRPRGSVPLGLVPRPEPPERRVECPEIALPARLRARLKLAPPTPSRPRLPQSLSRSASRRVSRRLLFHPSDWGSLPSVVDPTVHRGGHVECQYHLDRARRCRRPDFAAAIRINYAYRNRPKLYRFGNY